MGIARFASCIYVILCKTTSDVDIMHNYRHRIVFKAFGGPIATVCGALSRHNRTLLYISSIPEF